MNAVILIQLFLAHILTDFVFQPDSWVVKKNKSDIGGIHFWIHTFLAGFFTYLLLEQWNRFSIPVFIMVSHGLIDYGKAWVSRKYSEEKKRKYFILDQSLHLIVLLIAWLYLINGFDRVVPFLQFLGTNETAITIITAVVFLVWPAGIAIGKFTEPFRKQIDTSDSLEKAGKYIGVFERILVFIFILYNQYAAIGFLIAAKSILRVTEKESGSQGKNDSRKKTEYVLIGTFISFTMAILTGILVNSLIQNP